MRPLFYLLVLSVPYVSQAAVSLPEAFASARLNMESIKRAKIMAEAAEEQKVQARAALLPTLTAVGNETRIDKPKDASVNRAFVLERQYSAGLRLQQPLIRGGALSGLDLAKDQVLLAQFQKDATEINLYQLIINSYYRYYQALLDQKNLQELLKFSQDRVKEIKGRTAIGRSRKGELVQAETQLLTAQSQFEQADINLIQARETLQFYTGMSNVELAPLGKLPKELPGLESYLNRLKQRPDLLAQYQQVKMAERRINIAKGGHYPQLDFVGNYYIDRTGALASSDWDAALVVSIPIFQGGAVQSQVREAAFEKRAVEYDMKQNLRSAETDLRILYENYKLIHQQLNSLEQAVKKAREAYTLNSKDYELGLVTNLDVLQSLNIFIETKRSYDGLMAQAHQIHKTIEATSGVLP